MAAEQKLTRNEQKLRTRQDIVKAANKLFSKNGISNSSTASIAEEAKISHGTIFVHFPTRDDLILAVMDEFSTKLAFEFGNCSDQKDLRSLLLFHLEVLAEFEDFYFRLISELSFLPKIVRSQLFMVNSAISWKMYNSAKPEIEKKNIKEMSQAMLFNTWISLVHYYVMNRDLLADSAPILTFKKKDLVDHYFNLIT